MKVAKIHLIRVCAYTSRHVYVVAKDILGMVSGIKV